MLLLLALVLLRALFDPGIPIAQASTPPLPRSVAAGRCERSDAGACIALSMCGA
ncbi:MAG: hypothetical protein R2867_16130 [Caldilineaceae bacterium]